jgi:ABC-type branched-subunit amino acid transport system substrate-binding protein
MGMINPGGGMADPAYASSLGDLSHGVLFAESWSPLVESDTGDEINAKFEAKYGYPLAGATATTYVTTHLLAAALEKSCSRDPKALAEVLRTESFPDGVWNFMYPSGIKFDETGYVIDPLVVVIQLQNGQPVPVWPADLAQGEVIWPVPGWKDR